MAKAAFNPKTKTKQQAVYMRWCLAAIYAPFQQRQQKQTLKTPTKASNCQIRNLPAAAACRMRSCRMPDAGVCGP
jgi:hypothetical protein